MQSLLQQHNLCSKCLMATKQTTGSDAVIGSAVIPEWFSHAVLCREVSFLNLVSFPLTCMYYFCPQTPHTHARFGMFTNVPTTWSYLWWTQWEVDGVYSICSGFLIPVSIFALQHFVSCCAKCLIVTHKIAYCAFLCLHTEKITVVSCSCRTGLFTISHTIHS